MKSPSTFFLPPFFLIVLIFFVNVLLVVSASAQGLRTWGLNNYGQLGTGNVTMQVLPVNIGQDGITGSSGGNWHSLFLQPDGTLLATGNNDEGQLGDNTVINKTSSVPVLGITDVTHIAGGGYFSLALLSNGAVMAWGRNDFGQLGDGTNNRRLVPFQVVNLTNVIAVDAGYEFSLALKSDGTVWAWGNNDRGQLGDATTTSHSTPMQVLGLTDVIAIGAGNLHSLALKSDGTVWAWGFNEYGQLGNNTTGLGGCLCTTTPTQSTISGVAQIAVGAHHNVALKPDGTVWAWGNAFHGQVGDGSTPNTGCQCRPVPVQSTITQVIDVRARGHHNIVRKTDGSVWSWGHAQYGEMGNGSNPAVGCTCFPSPVQALAGSGNAAIGAGWFHSFAIRPSIPTPGGSNIKHAGDNVTITFSSVSNSGTTNYSAIDPMTTGLTLAPNHRIVENSPAYNVTTTAITTGPIDVCINVPTVYSQASFDALRLFHGEGPNLVDRTFSHSYPAREICARVTSLSPFVLANVLTAASATVDGRVLDSNKRGINKATVSMSDSAGAARTAVTNAFGYYRFENVPIGVSYLLQVSSKLYRFTPHVLTVNEDFHNVNFTAN
jgi:alpha-tubulin suppressor-like RCC1 family protein